jgi:peptide-methionine (S)-S-oxide reductase
MKTEIATLGGGCFWCLEAVYKRIDGVEKVVSGYSGGESQNPTYKEVCSGMSGHAEVVQITYDADRVGFNDLLDVFWVIHDPTSLNKQGADMGTQYRSVIYYHDDTQKETAQKAIDDLNGRLDHPVVTELSPLELFYPAEDYHQDYFDTNPHEGYCMVVIDPKIEKFKEKFKTLLKEEA